MNEGFLRCRECGRDLPIGNFKENPRYGIASVCNECVAKKRNASREKKKEEQRLKLAKARLSDFTPRELMLELKRRGYEGTITYTEVHTIKLEQL